MRWIYRASLYFWLATLSSSTMAWENHALPTWIALSQMPDVMQAEKVPVETLEDFVRAEKMGLEKLLRDQEIWARMHIMQYPPRPKKFEFVASGSDEKFLREQFMRALRVNPKMKFALFVQEIHGQKTRDAIYLSPSDVTLLPNALTATGKFFVELKPRDWVAPIDVFSTAADEPDFGLDIGLWQDSKTSFGKEFGFGLQPYGNPKLEYGTQAPFHMAFYHEPKFIYFVADYLSGTLPEYRMHQFSTLARYAFATGHPYWGWRFAGLGAHYVQDLTQPYHSTILPGESSAKLLLYGLLDAIGIHGPKEELVQRASEEHAAIENHAYCELIGLLQKNDRRHPIWFALARNDERPVSYAPPYVRDMLTKQSHHFADRVAEAMRLILPAKTLIKAAHAEENDAMNPLCQSGSVPERTQVLLVELMKNLGSHTRNWIRAIRAK